MQLVSKHQVHRKITIINIAHIITAVIRLYSWKFDLFMVLDPEKNLRKERREAYPFV